MTDLGAMRSWELRAWPQVGDPVLLADVALDREMEAPPAVRTSFATRAAVRRLGFVLYFETRLSPSVSISTAPSKAPEDNHWLCYVFRAAGERPRACGETVTVEFSAGAGESLLRVV